VTEETVKPRVTTPALYSFLTAIVALLCGTALALNDVDATALWIIAGGGTVGGAAFTKVTTS